MTSLVFPSSVVNVAVHRLPVNRRSVCLSSEADAARFLTKGSGRIQPKMLAKSKASVVQSAIGLETTPS
jgi:hypothetical protein